MLGGVWGDISVGLLPCLIVPPHSQRPPLTAKEGVIQALYLLVEIESSPSVAQVVRLLLWFGTVIKLNWLELRDASGMGFLRMSACTHDSWYSASVTAASNLVGWWRRIHSAILAGSPFTNCLSTNRLHQALLPLLRAGPQPPGHRVTAWHRRTASHPIPYEALMVVLQGELHPIYNYMPDIHKMAPCHRRQAESRQLSLPPRSWSWHEKPPRRLNLNCT